MRTKERINRYQSEETELLKVINTSLSLKKSKGWSRDNGAGFITEEIDGVWLEDELIKTVWEKGRETKNFYQTNFCVKTQGFTLRQLPKEYNLRETEEIVKFLKKKIAQEQLKALA